MDDALIGEPASPERRSLVPGEGFFVPDSVDRRRSAERAKSRLAESSVAVVADPDADGLACVAMVRTIHDDVALIDVGPHELDRGLSLVAEHLPPGAPVYVCDLAPDELAPIRDDLETIVERAGTVRWFDHHRWEPAVVKGVRDIGIDLVLGDSDAECTSDVALRSIEGALPEHLEELAAVTRDHDLWIRDDPRSDDLADFAHWSDPEEYVATVLQHGADLPAETLEHLAERREEKADLIDRALRRAEYRSIGDLTVGVTYGRCSQNEVAEAMREAGADAAVIVKPAGSASIRGTDRFDRCHEVAARVNGGGHPKAAGCKPDIYEDMLDYAHHWTTEGATTKRVILEAFRAVVGTTAAGDA